MKKAEKTFPLSGCHALLTSGKKATPPGKSSVSTVTEVVPSLCFVS